MLQMTLPTTELPVPSVAVSAIDSTWSPTPSLPPANILLVDDQPANLLTLEATLGDLGQNLVTAHSGREALARILRDDFAVILLDVRMPDMDGFETAALIRSRDKSRHTPIIFLTAYDRTDIAVIKGYSLGAVDYLVKPFVPEILKSKVSIFVDLYQKTERLRLLERVEYERRLDEARQHWKTERLRQEALRERKRAAELAELDRRKNEFLAIVCHELRNPLAPLRNALQVLRLQGENAEPAAQALEIADRQLGHLTRLIGDLLDLARIGSGKMRLEKKPVDLAAVVRNAAAAARPQIEARRHRLPVSLPAQSLPLEGDPGRLEQVVVNLLTNAAKYTEPGGHIRVKAGRDGTELVLSVGDNGTGLAPEFLPTVFDLFVQAVPGSQDGLGIGLNLVRSLVDLHGGTVRAESDGLGKGSEFIVRLPAACGAPVATPIE